MAMITASLWVPRGAAAAFPTKYDVDEEELSRISKLAKMQLEDAKQDLEDVQTTHDAAKETSQDEDSEMEGNDVRVHQSHGDADDDLGVYDLENYDADETHGGDGAVSLVGNVRSLAYYGSNDEDPYIDTENGQDDNEEREELQILATDNVIVAAKVENEVPYMEIYVYEDDANNLYVHHDVMLPAVPLCVEWLDLPVNSNFGTIDKDARGNFVAVGTMDPDIEVWDLDTIDSMYPNAILGEGAEDASPSDPTQELKRRKRRKKSRKPNDDFHVDAVLSLAANRQHRNLLASGSADRTIKLWDLHNTKCAKSYTYHTDKVCSIAWHPENATTLLSGGYDRRVIVADMRTPDAAPPSWGVDSDVETIRWDPHQPQNFYVTTENGLLQMHDSRSAPSRPEESKAVWTLQAHDEAASSLDINSIIPGFIATGSSDKEVKLWDVKPTGPSMIVSRNIGVGRIFSTQFATDPEVAFRLAVSGSKGALQVWDTSTNAGVRRAFAHRVSMKATQDGDDRTIGIQEDSSDEEEEGGPEPGGTAQVAEKGWESMDDND